MRPTVERLDHVAVVVSDLKRSIDWYQKIFGLVPIYVEEWWNDDEAFLTIGDTLVALFQGTPEVHSNGELGGFKTHTAFRATEESFAQYKTYLGTLGIEVTTVDYKVTQSIYFKDPDGYEWEITKYA